ncbi:hypothetical protein M3697_11380 [Janibacter melonis]|uniref:hypothetical protein n=1 Tax=Janibacter melonis TaxID=262209 RepID=UPI002042D69C|nr:hypothetical protein [Janibacter melonis]MCM3555705.1 hypothetical protein [Janibacter melonis]
MTRLTISAEAISALGDRLEEIATHLEERSAQTRGTGDVDHGFVDRVAEEAVDRVYGDFEHARVTLCAQLTSLARLARSAGACYVDTDDMVRRSVTPTFERGTKVGTL